MGIILSYDPGWVNHGISLLRYDSNTIEIIKSRSLKFEEKDEGLKLFQINQKFDEIFSVCKPDVFVYEKPVFKRGDMESKLSKVLGVIILSAYTQNTPIKFYSPNEVKKFICGTGKASKEEVQNNVNKILEIDKIYERDHESDAIAIGLTYFGKELRSS